MFVLVDDQTANINGRSFRICGLVEASEKFPPLIEASSKEDNRFDDLLFIRDLKGVAPRQFPNLFRVMIYGITEANFSYASDVCFRRHHSEAEISYTFDIDHLKWDQPINFKHFLSVFCDVLRTQLPRVNDVSQEHMEGLTFVTVDIGMDLDADCFNVFREVDLNMIRLFRQTLDRPMKLEISSASEKSDTGLKWWMRYVIVPVACSSGFAALATLIWNLWQ